MPGVKEAELKARRRRSAAFLTSRPGSDKKTDSRSPGGPNRDPAVADTQAFAATLNGRQNMQIMAHFVSQSRVSASNNLHRVWDERMEAKNGKRKVGQPTLAEAFKKASKKKKD